MFDVSTTEGFQLLRSSVLARLPRQSAVISICPVGTANRSGEFGFALAAALERSGRRIVLVLGQTGPASPYVWVPAGPGLTDVVLNPGLGEHLDELLHRLSDRLWVLPPGRVLRDVADVYQSTGMADLIRRLRGVADIVLVAAPNLGSAAGRTLAGVGDSALLMIGMAETRHGTLMEAHDELALRNIGVIGVVGVSRGRRRQRKPAKRPEVALSSRLATRTMAPMPPAPAESTPTPTVASKTGPAGPVEQPVQPVQPPRTMQPPRRPPLLRPSQPDGLPANGNDRPVTAAAPGESEMSTGAAAAASTEAQSMTLPKLTGKPDEPGEPAELGEPAEPAQSTEPTQSAEPTMDQSIDGEPASPGGSDKSGGAGPRASSGRTEVPAASPPR
jgi:hypothetical protein